MSAWFGEEKVRTRVMEISSRFIHALVDAREVGEHGFEKAQIGHY